MKEWLENIRAKYKQQLYDDETKLKHQDFIPSYKHQIYETTPKPDLFSYSKSLYKSLQEKSV